MQLLSFLQVELQNQDLLSLEVGFEGHSRDKPIAVAVQPSERIWHVFRIFVFAPEHSAWRDLVRFGLRRWSPDVVADEDIAREHRGRETRGC